MSKINKLATFRCKTGVSWRIVALVLRLACSAANKGWLTIQPCRNVYEEADKLRWPVKVDMLTRECEKAVFDFIFGLLTKIWIDRISLYLFLIFNQPGLTSYQHLNASKPQRPMRAAREGPDLRRRRLTFPHCICSPKLTPSFL